MVASCFVLLNMFIPEVLKQGDPKKFIIEYRKAYGGVTMELKICPQCNNKDIHRGIIRAAHAPLHMFPEESFKTNAPLNSHLRKNSKISSYYCQDCGYILGMFVDEPHKLT